MRMTDGSEETGHLLLRWQTLMLLWQERLHPNTDIYVNDSPGNSGSFGQSEVMVYDGLANCAG